MKKIVTLSTCILITCISFAQNPGDLVQTYGMNGISVISLTDRRNVLSDIALQSNDRLITAGKTFYLPTSEWNTMATRLTKDGMLDNFGNNSIFFQNDFNNDEDEEAFACCVLPDDKILLAGAYTSGSEEYHFVSQLTSDGQLDPSFGNAGSYINESIPFYMISLKTYASSSLNTILACGSSGTFDPAMLTLDENGDPVSSFGDNGYYICTELHCYFTDIVVDRTGGYIYACGFNRLVPAYCFVSKHNLITGALVTTFADNGVMKINPFGSALLFTTYTIVFEEDTDLITVFGDYKHTDGDFDIFAFRLHANDGSFDNSFGLNGFSTLRIPSSNEYINTAVLQSNGQYYFGGYTDSSADNDFMLGRIDTNGVLDQTFGNNGFTITDMGLDEQIEKLVLNENESRILAGGNISSGNHQMMVACYHTGYHPSGIVSNKDQGIHATIYPNPVNGDNFTVSFDINHESELIINLLSIEGQLIKQCSSAHKTAGNYSETFHLPSGLPGGVYIIEMKLTNYSTFLKLVNY